MPISDIHGVSWRIIESIFSEVAIIISVLTNNPAINAAIPKLI